MWSSFTGHTLYKKSENALYINIIRFRSSDTSLTSFKLLCQVLFSASCFSSSSYERNSSWNIRRARLLHRHRRRHRHRRTRCCDYGAVRFPHKRFPFPDSAHNDLSAFRNFFVHTKEMHTLPDRRLRQELQTRQTKQKNCLHFSRTHPETGSLISDKQPGLSLFLPDADPEIRPDTPLPMLSAYPILYFHHTPIGSSSNHPGVNSYKYSSAFSSYRQCWWMENFKSTTSPSSYSRSRSSRT